jgi:hypothetical protein
LVPAFKERLQNQSRRYLVHNFTVLLSIMPGLVEDLVGFAGRQSLIPQVNRKPSERAQLRRKRLDFGSPRALFAGKVQRVPDHDAGHSIPPGEAGQGAQVLAGAALSLKRENRLRSQAEFVGHGDSDAPGAHIETEIARLGGGLQRVLPPTSL